MSELLDTSKPVREGESFDLEAVDAWLKPKVDGIEGTPALTQFPSGASNLTYLLTYPGRDLILRRPPFGKKAKGAHDMGREVRVLRSLDGKYPVPEVLAYCEDHDVMGADFYVMNRIEGIILRKNMPEALGDEETVRQICERVIDKMIELHNLDVTGTELDEMGKGEGYVERQITGWSKRYRDAVTPDATDFERTMGWLAENMPDDLANTPIHNDFRFDNVILDPGSLEVIGVLDWEMCTMGDPLMDLGNTLAYWIQDDDPAEFQMMRRQPTQAPGMMTRDEVIDYYGANTRWDVSDFDFYMVYGYFRLAVILQQIYYRYYHGQTSDQRFAIFVEAARVLERACERILDER